MKTTAFDARIKGPYVDLTSLGAGLAGAATQASREKGFEGVVGSGLFTQSQCEKVDRRIRRALREGAWSLGRWPDSWNDEEEQW